MTGPFVPVGILNPIRAVLGILHHRFNLFVECSSAVSAAKNGRRRVTTGWRHAVVIDAAIAKQGASYLEAGQTLLMADHDRPQATRHRLCGSIAFYFTLTGIGVVALPCIGASASWKRR
jgi:hypothetical protein